MSQPTSHFLEGDGAKIHYLRWNEPHEGRPTAVLTHGLGFVGASWMLLACELARDYTVYAIDRRGHGLSELTGERDFSFELFSRDLILFLDTLGVRGAYGIGHSSGATDMLLAAAARPHAFERILAVEPTAQDPRAQREPDPTLSELCQGFVERTRYRKGPYPSREKALEMLRKRSPIQNWHPELLRAQIDHGYRDAPGGGVEPCCPPTVEAEMLVPIFQTMENRYPGREFERLLEIRCPVLVISADESNPVFGAMAALVAQVIPGARLEHRQGATHFWPQERPDEFAQQVATFASTVTRSPTWT
ncbi:alpha/beta hydrolase [Stigmatella sp. ncwal1]|uniref:Alpha/beta hydrolase n=1 Tax=Stigmatella ashevillensis TaxID=2995309 RepID=A0ABT5D4Y6_9BACT|nr:alpha/beta hydrolase [Stigmatella ashevillena]MDC0708730.1 alpha/beta hydrolase [Stigmatella ashevillena]